MSTPAALALAQRVAGVYAHRKSSVVQVSEFVRENASVFGGDYGACEFGDAWDQGLTVLGVVETMTAKMAVAQWLFQGNPHFPGAQRDKLKKKKVKQRRCDELSYVRTCCALALRIARSHRMVSHRGRRRTARVRAEVHDELCSIGADFL
jgi:hypothetical protein